MRSFHWCYVYGGGMPSEELQQKGYWDGTGLHGDRFGIYESLNIGATSLQQLVAAGLNLTLPAAVSFPFVELRAPKVRTAKPDQLVVLREAEGLLPVALLEHKTAGETDNDRKRLKAAEQALFYGIATGVQLAAFTDGTTTWYIDVKTSIEAQTVTLIEDNRPWSAAVVGDLLSTVPGAPKDPTPLAESVWQIIWHATKAEPKECLLTFVEIFMLKFLSDNLPISRLPRSFRFEELLTEEAAFLNQHGKLQIEYYVTDIRPRIKALFPDNVIADEPGLGALFGLETIVSKTSVINGFAFLRSSDQNLSSFNRTFVQILEAFDAFGALLEVDPEFKLRLYETFLRRSARQQRLGQFFTPRNIVKPMVRMAELGALPDGAVVLDPAAGVGGFVLEPLLFEDALPGNVTFSLGTSRRRVRTIGVDVDKDLHILAKANMLLHHAESVRDSRTTPSALNKAMANTFILMNENEMLGSLLNPPTEAADVILTNPPYVTQGSAVYKTAVAEVPGTRNGKNLRSYYDTGGLGVEALFLRYISGALKPGGRAFVIVPLGLLNRSESRPKRALLDECNLLASISLPRKAFFNTPQPTYIVVLERRHSDADERPDVFCAIARSTGETLDARRTPTHAENDLADIAEAFVSWRHGDRAPADAMTNVKIEPSTRFSEDDRWDVPRFWTDDELVSLSVRSAPLTKTEFVEEAADQIRQLLDDLDSAKLELATLTPTAMVRVSLDDKSTFRIRPGVRVTHEEVRQHQGWLPVYSCFTRSDAVKGHVSAKWALAKGLHLIRAKTPTVTVNATGASGVGIVFVRDHNCAITDDVIAVEIVEDIRIDVPYLAAALSAAIAGGDFQYEAKLYQKRLRELFVDIPTLSDGAYDLELQQEIGRVTFRVEQLQERLVDLGVWSKAARLT
jgi:type I restriction enzyme M protein